MTKEGMLTVLVVLPMIFLSGAHTSPEFITSRMRGLINSPAPLCPQCGFGILLKGPD
jgi:hypothetical protein